MASTPVDETDEAAKLSAAQFKRWTRMMGLSGGGAAKALGVSRATVVNYQRNGAPAAIRAMCRVLYPRQVEAVYPWEVESK